MKITLFLIASLLILTATGVKAQIVLEHYVPKGLLSAEGYGKTHSHVFHRFSQDSVPSSGSLLIAQEAYIQEKDSLCIARIDAALESATHKAPLYLLRGAANYRRGEVSTAFADFNQVVTLAPEQPEGYHNLSLLYLVSNKLVYAYRFVNIALQVGEEHPETIYLLGVLQLSNSNHAEAKQLWNLYLQSRKADPKIHIQMALHHFLLKEDKEALVALGEAEEKKQDLLTVYLLGGIINDHLKERGKAFAKWQQGYETLQEKEIFALLLGYYHIDEKLYKKGLDYLVEGYLSRPFKDVDNSVEPVQQYEFLSIQELILAYDAVRASLAPATKGIVDEALTNFLIDDPVPAVRLFKKAQKTDPNNVFFPFALGIAEAAIDRGRAMKFFQEAHALDPDYAPLMQQYVRFYTWYMDRKAEDMEDAFPGQTAPAVIFVDYIDRLIHRFPEREIYLLYKGDYLVAQGKLEAAAEIYTAYLSISDGEKDLKVRLRRGTAYIFTDQLDLALKDYKIVYNAQTGLTEGILQNYVLLLYENGETQEAWKLLNAILAGGPERMEGILHLKGVFLYQEEKYQESMGIFLQLKSNVSGRVIYSELPIDIAFNYIKLGLHEKAIEELDRVILLWKGNEVDGVMEEMRSNLIAKSTYVKGMAEEALGNREKANMLYAEAGEAGYVHKTEVSAGYSVSMTLGVGLEKLRVLMR